MASEAQFDVVLRGYDRSEVDAAVQAAAIALASSDPARRAAAGTALQRREFRRSMRGYDSEQVDAYLQEVARELTG